ncbi:MULTISPECIES: polysaccharide biosynthesis/export family protein [unclassified Cupriavidus]|uniref:polysaccharide biosynthesis/export family protein n=1 Tax=unclassified Cupriavidus TaxID=2640874 RepID=UPI0028B41978|nr:polysaccharide biosynthesis/export family protein [Cupriavidus sp. SZY C1]MDT6962746.1 polysaccharide biosynthesis/export family protein [Cupriavidus sp. SZY C1]
MRSQITMALLLAGTLLAGCAWAPGMRVDRDAPAASAPDGVTPISWDLVNALRSTRSTQDIDDLLGAVQPYRIGPADILSIVVWDHPELVFPSQTYTVGIGYEIPGYSGAASVPGYVVSHHGDIQFPYAGVVKVAGLTVDQVRTRLTRALAGVVRQPQVTVRVLAYRSQRIYLDGEVRLPGPQYVDDVPMTLIEALGRAGGVNVNTGDSSRIRISRKARSWVVDLPALLRAGRNPADIQLRSGDIVRVEQREDGKVFVLGEVNKPVAVLPRNGRLTLNEALGEAGGVNPQTSDPRQIYVVRRHDSGRPEVFHLDAASPVAMALAEGFPLQPRDVVYVDAGDITRWARVVNQLIPSAQYVNSTANVLK